MTFDEWAKSIMKYGSDAEYGIAKAAWDAGQKEEREACAVECERMKMYKGGREEAPVHNNVWEAASAIRSRTTK